MNLNFDIQQALNYRSSAQAVRVMTEKWLADNMFCPHCGRTHIEHFPNNRPVADFYCPDCQNEYELKSKSGTVGRKVNDGAYKTMIERITGNINPDFFFLNYSREKFCVMDLVLVPKYFFVPNIIEARVPLKKTAKRAGWIGCNILIGDIPDQGRIEIISNGIAVPPEKVIEKVNNAEKLKFKDINARGWLLDTLLCVNSIEGNNFTLSDVYVFDTWLSGRHPANRNIRPKIRQQLQILRDKGFVEFIGQGNYRKLYCDEKSCCSG